MVLFSMKCPKCGLIQRQSPTCKSCGAAVSDTLSLAEPPQVGGRSRAAQPPSLARPLPEDHWQPSRTKAGSGEPYRLFFHGDGGSLFGIHIVNIFLTLVTLGIYSFWGRVKVRRYLLSQTEFEGDRFAYHGTGRELLIGSLKAMLVFGVPLAVLNYAPSLLGAGTAINIAAAILLYGILLVFIPFAIVSARRYRLSRTSWRGIRFSFRGRMVEFIKLFVGGSLLTMITLGLYYPIFETRQHGFMVSHSYLGNEKFHFDGRGRDLFGSFLLALLLFLPTLGLYWFWFLAKKDRYLWAHTSFGTASFRSTVTGANMLLLKLGNLLLLVFTLGLAWSWVLVRKARFVFAYLSLEGALDLEGIQQEAQVASATGEGLASFLDLDAGFDLG